MSNRTDFAEVAREIVEMFTVDPATTRPGGETLVARLEAELHDAFVAGEESCVCVPFDQAHREDASSGGACACGSSLAVPCICGATSPGAAVLEASDLTLERWRTATSAAPAASPPPPEPFPRAPRGTEDDGAIAPPPKPCSVRVGMWWCIAHAGHDGDVHLVPPDRELPAADFGPRRNR
jgi:hypothetical protein